VASSSTRPHQQDAAFFDHHNPVGLAERERAFQLALADMLAFLSTPTGQVAIFDATNSTQERREKLVSGSGRGGRGLCLSTEAWALRACGAYLKLLLP
jgi:hypothetical protein